MALGNLAFNGMDLSEKLENGFDSERRTESHMANRMGDGGLSLGGETICLAH